MVEINKRNSQFTERDIIEECCTFMLAGQDSVGTAIAMTLFLLANNSKWQEKCITELQEIFGNDRRTPTMQDLRKMKCLDMCIKESMRLYPSVPLFARTLGKDVRLGKILLEKKKILQLFHDLILCIPFTFIHNYFKFITVTFNYLWLFFR